MSRNEHGRVAVGVASFSSPNDPGGFEPRPHRRCARHPTRPRPRPPRSRPPDPDGERAARLRPRPSRPRPVRRLHAALLGLRRRRQLGPRAVRARRERAAPSRLAHQGHDPVPAVRAVPEGTPVARQHDGDLAPRRRAAADQARPSPRLHHPHRGRDLRHRHQVLQRHGGRGRREDRRRRGDLRAVDDAQGARARHVAHQLRQRVRPARRHAADERARHGHAGPRQSTTISRSTSTTSRRRRSATTASSWPTTTT